MASTAVAPASVQRSAYVIHGKRRLMGSKISRACAHENGDTVGVTKRARLSMGFGRTSWRAQPSMSSKACTAEHGTDVHIVACTAKQP
eukprot:363732-Chlamydomonas_euryale.AAC.4